MEYNSGSGLIDWWLIYWLKNWLIKWLISLVPKLSHKKLVNKLENCLVCRKKWPYDYFFRDFEEGVDGRILESG